MASARVLRAAALIAALSSRSIFACSSDSSGPAARYAGGWTGSTSQGHALRFLVAEDGIVVLTVAVATSGPGCTDTLIALVGRDPSEAPFAITGGDVTVSWNTSRGNRTVVGTFDGTSASGTMTAGDNVCGDTVNVSWTAEKATGAAVNLTGTWDGEFSSSRFAPTPGSMALSQSGASLTGTWSAGSGGSGSVSGTVSGYGATFRLNQTTSGCSGRFDGYAVVVPIFGDLVFWYSGQDCLGPHVDGFGFGVRVPLSASLGRPGLELARAARP